MTDDFSADVSTTGILLTDGSVSAGTIEVAGDQDWFALTLTEAQTLRIDITGTTLESAFFEIFDASGVNTNLTLGTLSPPFTLEFEAGTYYIAAGAFLGGSETGAYEITATQVPLDGPDDFSSDINTQGELVLGEVTSGVIDIPNDTDWFALDVVAGTTYLIETISDMTGSFLDYNYFNSAGGVLEVADSNLTQGFGRGFTAITTETIFVEVEVGFGGATGEYSILATEFDTSQLPTPPNPIIPPNPTPDDFAADITTTGVLLTDGSASAGVLEIFGDNDWFALTIDEAQTLQINLTGLTLGSGRFQILDSSGSFFANFSPQESSSDVLDTELTFLEAGTYFVRVTDGFHSDIGSYELTATLVESPQGDEADNILQGIAFNDVLLGQAGNDHLYGEAFRPLSLDSIEGQLFRAYQAVFDRAPDESGFNAFLTEIRLGNLDQEDVIAEFVESVEFQNTYGDLDNLAFIEQLYLNVLDRPGDDQGVADFTEALIGGRSRESVVFELANSPEFVQLMVLPSASFATNVIIHPAEAQVFRLYQAVFQRDPDEGGFTAFTNAIQAGVLTVEDITPEFVSSAEFQLTYGLLNDAEFVDLLYANVLPGNTDMQGRAMFTASLESGVLTRAEMVAEFVESFEFVQRMLEPAAEFVAAVFSSTSDMNLPLILKRVIKTQFSTSPQEPTRLIWVIILPLIALQKLSRRVRKSV